MLKEAKRPVILAGHGAARADATTALVQLSEELGIQVANTFHGKGVMPDDHPNGMGTLGFMRHDYVNFGFDDADTIIAVGYELQEFDPVRINPNATSGSSTCTGFRPRWTRTTPSTSASWAISAPHSTQSGRRWPGNATTGSAPRPALICSPRRSHAAPMMRATRWPPGPGGGRYPGRAGTQRYRVGRHRCGQDVDGQALPDL